MKKTDRQNSRTNGKSKAIQTKSHREASHTHSPKEKKEKNIYILYIKKRKRATKSINNSTNDNKL